VSESSGGVRELIGAVRAGDTAKTARILAEHPALRGRLNEALPGLHFDSTVIHAAAETENLELIDLLTAAGADINQLTHWWAGGFHVLDSAAPAFAPHLIERGAEVSINAAARLGMLDRVKELVAANRAAVNARGGDGQTPLHVASTVDIARLLLDHGADIDALDVDHESTPAQYLVRDHPDVARYLVGRGCKTDILLLAALGDLDGVRALLDEDPARSRTSLNERFFPKRNPRAGGTIYQWTLGGNALAHLVARDSGHEDVFNFLIERSPAELRLVVVCELNDQAGVDALLAASPNLAATLTQDDQLRLVNAAQSNDTGKVARMLAAGWPVSVHEPKGGTALHWAAFHGNLAMARELLKYDPPLDLREGAFNATPLGWAQHGTENSWHRRTGDYRATTDALVAAGAATPPPDQG
jgi:ankyrin repeat protein